MKKINIYSILCFGLLSIFSCNKEKEFEPYERTNSTITELVATIISNGFEYNTTNSVELSVTLKNNSSEPLSNVYLQVFTQDPEDEDGNLNTNILPLFKGSTNVDGSLNVQLSVPTYVTQLYVCPEYIGVGNKFILPLTSKKNKVTFTTNNDNLKSESILLKNSIAGMITLGTWSSLGVPDYLCGQDLISSAFLQRINGVLPESKKLPVIHPEYFNSNVCTNIILQEKGEIYITFLHEGAGWKNTFGYYSYKIGEEPQTIEDIKNLTIIFPNSSYEGSGGGLFSGDKVYLGEFPKNTVVAWFVVAQGWNGSTVTNGAFKVFSDEWLNPETNLDLKQHSILIYDPTTERYIIGFEDTNRDKTSCDNDFNDIVFYATVTPNNAVIGDDIIVIDEPIDTDGDGVIDTNDDYPNDKELSYDNLSNWATLAYEDLWPSKGDYDFNDLVLSYQINQISNAQNLVVKIQTKMSIRAIGAGFHNGFALQFPISPSNVEHVTGTVLSTANYFQIASNGTELNQTTAVIPIFDDAYFAFTQRGMINVYPDVAFEQPDTFAVEIKFSIPQTFSALGLLPFNPFIVKNGDRSIEIHLPNKLPTDLVDNSYFGTQNDSSNLSAGRTYISVDGKPWGINIASEFYHPYEKNEIGTAYLKYNEWANSYGVSFPNWYLDIAGYRDISKIYPKP